MDQNLYINAGYDDYDDAIDDPTIIRGFFLGGEWESLGEGGYRKISMPGAECWVRHPHVGRI